MTELRPAQGLGVAKLVAIHLEEKRRELIQASAPFSIANLSNLNQSCTMNE